MRLVLVLWIVISGCHGETPPARVAAPAPLSFGVPADPGILVTDAAAFARFAGEVRGKLAGRDDTDARFVLAMLDALDERWPEAVATLDRIAAAERDPKARVMRGLTIRVWADALAAHGSFRDALAARVAALPGEVAPALVELRAMGVAFTPAVCRQLVTENVHPQAGAVGLADVHTIVFQRYAVVRLVPVGKDIDEVLAARGVALPPE